MLRARANESEISQLLDRLGSRKRSTVDAARARLSVIGARAVEDLIETLEGEDDRVRARVMPLLALIQDSRGRGPLMAMLLDTNPRLREIAAQCLGRFPAPESVAALARLLRGERRQRVRVATVRALVEQYAGGQETAVSTVLERLSDLKEPRPVRLAGLALLPVLRPAGRRSLLRHLCDDPDPELRQAAGRFVDEQKDGSGASKVDPWLRQLGSDDYAVWNRALQKLRALGPSAVQPLVAEMQRRGNDPEFCTRTGMALKAMGPRRGRAVADALDTVEEPLALYVIVEVLGAFGDKSLIYRLKNLVDRLAEARDSDAGVESMQRVRARAHLELARIGSRVAIQDLREGLGDSNRRVELELLAAVRLIGQKDELAVLLRAHPREVDYVREAIADVVRSIMSRERIRRNNKVFRTMSREQIQTLQLILPPRRKRPAPGAAPST